MARVRRPSTTVEGRENQLIALATDLAEKQLAEGTASSQVITHYLKLGSTKEQLEREKLLQENALLRAKTERIKTDARNDEFYKELTTALRSYSPEWGDLGDDDL